jgi:hypothetical protein
MAKELVKAGSNPVATRPSYLDKYVGDNTGLEAITSKDMTMPRLAIAQRMHKETQEDNSKYLDGLKPGMFFNTLTKDIYGKGPLVVVPLFARKHRRYFTERDAGSKTICVSENGINGGRISPKSCAACKHSKFGFDSAKQKTTKPDCTLFWSYIILLVANEDFSTVYPMGISLKSKMIKSAEDFNSFMRLRQTPAFTGVYTLNTFLDNSPAGDFYNVKFENADFVPEAFLENVRLMMESYHDKVDTIIAEHAEQSDVEEGELVDDKDVPF